MLLFINNSVLKLLKQTSTILGAKIPTFHKYYLVFQPDFGSFGIFGYFCVLHSVNICCFAYSQSCPGVSFYGVLLEFLKRLPLKEGSGLWGGEF